MATSTHPTSPNLKDAPSKDDVAKPAVAPKKRASAPRKKTAKRAPAKKKPGTTKAGAAVAPHPMAMPRELGGFLLLVLALGLLLALVSFSPADVHPGGVENVQNLIGPVGAHLGDITLAILGLGAFFLDALMWYIGAVVLLGRTPQFRPTAYAGQLLFVISGTVIAHLVVGHDLFFGHSAGGAIGEFVAELGRGAFGTVGAYMMAVVMLVVSAMFVLRLSLSMVARMIAERAHQALAYVKHHAKVYVAYRQRFAEERARLMHEHYTEGDHATLDAQLAMQPIGAPSYAFEESFEDQVQSRLTNKLQRLFGLPESPMPAPPKKQLKPPKPPKRAKAAKGLEDVIVDAAHAAQHPAPPIAPPKINGEPVESDDAWSMGKPLATEDDSKMISKGKNAPVDDATGNTLQVDDADVVDMAVERNPKPSPLGESNGDFGPKIVARDKTQQEMRIREMLERADGEGVVFKPQRPGTYELPKLSFLNYEDDNKEGVDIEVLRDMAGQIEQTLRDFKVEGTIQNICPGPVITVFEFSPAPGVKISKIANLSDDLAMALSALSVRIVAPIPGKGVVGIEVPNPTREIVYMKEIIANDVFIGDEKMALPMGLGKDTAGEPIVTDLAKMPHLLVAGATGSGKSVAVNTMITSLLYKNTPDDVRLIMVDPKMLEFSIYADIPHLLLPVVTDPKQATVALNWAVQEMERRYHALADLNVRNVKGYNTKVEKIVKQVELDMAAGLDETDAIKAIGLDAQGNPSHKRLPYIVVIIDEFADLMMTASKDVETAVARLAQKARAAGIHLILATQRPSTDVITGLIKANFPTRIALRVTSKTDSRVILDSNGAENLLGNGDMLFVPPGTSHVKRVHGAYVSEHEIEKLVAFLKTQGKPQYDESILVEEDEDGESAIDDADRDEYYKDAVRLVVESQQASISMIQRKLRVGYNRAARMVEMMETEGIVTPPNGSTPREVVLDQYPY